MSGVPSGSGRLRRKGASAIFPAFLMIGSFALRAGCIIMILSKGNLQ